MTNNIKMVMGCGIAAAVAMLSGCSSDNTDGSSYTVSPGEVVFDGNSTGVGAIKDMKVSADGGTLYAGTNDITAGLVVIDLASSAHTIVDTGSVGRGIALSPDGSTIYVASSSTGADFTYVNRADNAIGTKIALNAPTNIALTGDGAAAYVGDGSGLFSKIDLVNATSTLTDTGKNSWWIPTVALSADESTLYIASSNFVSYSLTDNNYTEVGNRVHAFDVTNDDTKAYTTSGAILQIIDLTTNTVEANLTEINATNVFSNLKAVKLTADNRRLFAADVDYNDTLFMVNLENNNAISMIMNEGNVTCGLPDSIEISPNGSKVYMGCQNGVISTFSIIH